MTPSSTTTVPSLGVEIDIGSTVRAVTFTENGKHLVSGDDKGIRVWRVEDGKQLATMKTTYAVHCLAVSPDGSWIAAGTFLGYLFVWNARSYKQVIVHKEDVESIRAVAFSPDSTHLVAGTGTIWDLETRKQVRSLEHEDWVLAAKYSSKGDQIATATKSHVRIWDSNDGHMLLDVQTQVVPFYNTGLLWFDNHLFIILDEKIRQLDASTGETVAEWPIRDTNTYSCIALPKHGGFIAYTSYNTITFFDHSTCGPLGQIQYSQDMRSIVFSEDDQFVAISGAHGKISIQSLSRIIIPIPLSRLHHVSPQEPDVYIDAAAVEAWKYDQLENAEAALTAALTVSQNQSGQVLANRALVRTRLRLWDAALVDAEKAIDIQPSIVGYIAKSIAHVGNGESHKGYRACDIALERFHSSHATFLLLIKTIIVFMAGEHVDAISRTDDLIVTARFNFKSICYVIQAHMHLIHGDSHMERGNYENAIQSFELAQMKLRPHGSQMLFIISLITGWKFDNLDIKIRQRLCDALYLAGRAKDASESLLQLVRTVEKEVDMHEAIVEWIANFTKRCLSTPESNGDVILMQESNAPSVRDAYPTSLLKEWAKATLTCQSWKDALVDAVSFVTPKFVVYRAICEHLEAIDHVADVTECLLEMASELAQETDGNHAEWIGGLKDWCSRKLADLGEKAMSSRRFDTAIVQYSAALSLNLANPQALLVKRSRAQANLGLWQDALKDANEVIILDPSSPLGYERKYAALRGAGCYNDAKAAFETMVSKMSQSADPEIRERSRWYVQPAQIEAVVREAIGDAIRDSPLVLINTDSGRLLDKHGQASSFESQPMFHELVSSMGTDIDRVRIEDEVGQYYRYATFSHKWEDIEPLYDEVLQIVVYEFEESPTHAKLQMFCKVAREAGLHWAWSDTCCINKADPSVLQEALVSMFQWYQTSTMTVVLLCDVPSKRLVDSIWNSRAWTFQEYHASKVVRFYNKDWTLYRNLDVPNHKESPEIIAEMEEATGVSAQALTVLRPGLEDIREKLRLASTRQTTRVEDAAYSLLGIFSLSLSVVYGEGDKAVGRLLAQLLTSSGDTSILAWTGRSGSFNSCLPAKISVFSQSPTSHVPSAIRNTESESITAELRSLSLASVIRLYDALNALPVPLFNGKRMKLPCIVFKLGALSVSRSGSEQVFLGRTNALGIVEIKTAEDLTQIKPLYLVHPWIDYLLDQRPVESIMEAIPEETTGSDERSFSVEEPPSLSGSSQSSSAAPPPRRGFASRFGLTFGRQAATRTRDAVSLQRPSGTIRPHIPSYAGSLQAPSTLAEVDRQTRIFRAAARLRQRFGALLLTPDSRNVAAYRRVAPETVITVQVEEITPAVLDKLIENVRVLDVL